MKDERLFNFSNPDDFFNAFGFINYLKEKKSIVMIQEKTFTRSSAQNRALHLFFTWCANALNDSGKYFVYQGLKGSEIEIPWNGEMFKNFTWKPIQKVLYDIDSTTKLKRNEIDQIIDILIRHFGEQGILVRFPNSFDFWLEKLSTEKQTINSL